MWTHDEPQEEDRGSKRVDFNDTHPKFFMVSPTLMHYKVNPIPKSSWRGMIQEKGDGPVRLLWFDSTRLPSYTIPTTIVFLPLQGHAQTAVAQTYPWRLTHPPHPLPYLFPYTVRKSSATLTHHTSDYSAHQQNELAICWDSWPLLYAGVQVYIILLNTNIFSSCLFLKVSSPLPKGLFQPFFLSM